VRVMADRLSSSATRDSVAAADLDRLTGEPDDPILQVGVHLGPHETMHATQRAADHQMQMANLEPFGDQLVHGVDHIVIAVMWEIAFEPVRGFARAAATERIRYDDKISPSIQRLTILK